MTQTAAWQNIESPQGLSPEYKDMLIRLITRQLYAETATAEVFGRSIALAPTWPEKHRQAEFAHEEARHSQTLMDILADLGVDGQQILDKRPPAAFFWSLGDGKEINDWLDCITFNFIVDRAGSHQIMNYADNSYRPWAGAMGYVLEDEEDHYGSGVESMKELTKDEAVKARVEQIIQVLLPVTVKRAFGRPDAEDNEYCHAVGLKPRKTDEVVSGYLTEMRPHMEACGLYFPPLAAFEAKGAVLGPKSKELILSLQKPGA